MNSVNRKIDYLRISVTDRCNLRCVYCKPKGRIINKPQQDILTFEEIVRLVRIFSCLGVNKIRLTGGEPLIRKGIVSLIDYLANIKGIEEVSLTTNGTLLSLYSSQLKKAGIRRINVSLDTLRKDRFRRITGSDSFYQVLEGIEKAKEVGLAPLKLNTVVMKGVNDDEVIDFVRFALSKGLILRFIEFMKITPLWRKGHFIPIENIKKLCESKFILRKIGVTGPGPTEYYRIENDGLLGFIKTDAYNCQNCSRLRITPTGEFKICLYEDGGIHLRGLLRNGASDEAIKDIVGKRKEVKRHRSYKSWEFTKVYMCNVGG